MSDLYTSQVHLKRLLAGRATAAFTVPQGAVLQVLNPDYFPGLGALNEDENGRIQCPVRGCGTWHFAAASHMNKKHPTLGGAAGIRAALSIGKNVPLMSANARAHARATTGAAAKRMMATPTPAQRAAQASIVGGAIRKGKSYTTVHSRNQSDSCPAQLNEKVELLAAKLPHSPSANDFREEYGDAAFAAVERYFGTWNAAKAACGLTLHKPGSSYDTGRRSRTSASQAAECLRAWYDVHGDLPLSQEVISRLTVTPYVPSYKTLLSAFGVSTWGAAMQSAMDHLNITSERYGAPSRRSA